MTVIVGILCADGVVIGTDSAIATGRFSTGYTIERQDEAALKIEIIGTDVITAVTGATGLAQRFNDQIEITIQQLRQPFQPPTQFIPGFGFIGSKVQNTYAGKLAAGVIPYTAVKAVEIGRIISEAITDDFKRTQSTFQTQNGWGLGALFAFVHNDEPQLIDFDPTQFHPELRGQPDPNRDDQDRSWRCVSWGAGARLADSFLAHAYRLLFGELVADGSGKWKIKRPTIARAKLVVAWAIDHVRRYNMGLVGGKLQLAILEKRNDIWVAHHDDTGETEQQVADLEKYISVFGKIADESDVDLNAVLAGKTPIPEGKDKG